MMMTIMIIVVYNNNNYNNNNHTTDFNVMVTLLTSWVVMSQVHPLVTSLLRVVICRAKARPCCT